MSEFGSDFGASAENGNEVRKNNLEKLVEDRISVVKVLKAVGGEEKGI